jgi:hypothetical protein
MNACLLLQCGMVSAIIVRWVFARGGHGPRHGDHEHGREVMVVALLGALAYYVSAHMIT